jgi:hypothetical protein
MAVPFPNILDIIGPVLQPILLVVALYVAIKIGVPIVGRLRQRAKHVGRIFDQGFPGGDDVGVSGCLVSGQGSGITTQIRQVLCYRGGTWHGTLPFIPSRLPGWNGSAGKKFHEAGTNGFAQRYAVMSTEGARSPAGSGSRENERSEPKSADIGGKKAGSAGVQGSNAG